MKRIETIGLIALAALALTAVFGVGSASAATTLCKVNTEPCAEADRYPASTSIEASATNVATEGSFWFSMCNTSTLSGKTSEQAGTPLQVEITSLKFSGCGSCKSAASTASWSGSVSATSGGNGSLTAKETNLLFSECAGTSATCKFGAAETTVPVTGGSSPYIEFSKVPLGFKGGSWGESNCGALIRITGKYNIGKPKPMYVRTNLISGLCSENVAVCPSAHTYAAGTALAAALKSETSFVTAGTLKETCTGSSLAGETTSQSGVAVPLEISALTMSGCKPCTSAAALNLPYSAEVTQTGGGNGTVTVKSSGAGKPQFSFDKCVFGAGSCKFDATELSLELQGGNPAKLVANNAPLSFAGGTLGEGFCGSTTTLSATYELSAPAPLFATQRE